MKRTFSTSTADADPGNGIVRLNQATQNTATVSYIDLLDTDGVDQTVLIDSLDDSTSAIKGYLRFEKQSDATKYLLFTLSAWTTATDYRKLTLALIDSSAASPFANTDPLYLTFVREGDKGDTGAGGAAGATGPTGPAGSGVAPGSDTQVIFNDGGSAFGADAGMVYNKTTDALTLAGALTVGGQLTVKKTGGASEIILDTSAASTYEGDVWFRDNGVNKWTFYKSTGNNFGIYNNSTSADALTIDITNNQAVFSRSVILNNSAGDNDIQIKGDTDNNLLYADASTDSLGIGTATPASWTDLKAGTTARASLLLPSGVVLTTPVAGAVEYDGANWYYTENTTSKRACSVNEHIFELNADGGAIGAAIADFFGATSSINLPASSRWELEAHLYFLKTTAGTVTWTITNSAANYTNIAAHVIQSAVGGLGTGAQPIMAGIVGTTTAAAALPAASASNLTTATNHFADLFATIDMNAAGNIRIRATESAGTITPLRGSYYKIRRLPTSVGGFVA